MGLFDRLRRSRPVEPEQELLDLGVPTAPFAFGGSNVQVLGDLANVSEEQRAKLRMLGIDLDQLVAGATEGMAAAASIHSAAIQPPAAEDQLSRLERLAALRAQGVLTEAEFAQQKQRILGDG